MTEDDKALVERLKYLSVWVEAEHDLVDEAELWQAATRIEQLTAEVERLNREVLLQMGWKTEAQNEVDQLAVALDHIANESSDTWARDAARAALGDTQ